MSENRTSYSRADILNLKICDSNGFQIINQQILHIISQTSAIKGLGTKNGLHSKKTKQGCRAGKHKTRHITQQSTPDPIPAPSAKKTSQSHPVVRFINCGSLNNNNIPVPLIKKKNVTHTPSLLYTNCRSLNTWKLAELEAYAEIHKPSIICLTETWLNDDKQQTVNINGYKTHFCHRKNRNRRR
jgi:hypothetical protein